jgi:hypothetical protein
MLFFSACDSMLIHAPSMTVRELIQMSLRKKQFIVKILHFEHIINKVREVAC